MVTVAIEDLANCYARLGRYNDAIAAIDRCIESGYKGESDARAFQAEFLLQDGRMDEASAFFEEVRTIPRTMSGSTTRPPLLTRASVTTNELWSG
ncbi:MAG: hypothetical protein H0U16_05205 [Actinobacteria bacterium]|nr:hypothetical protein [Actinomycetota bacterium]